MHIAIKSAALGVLLMSTAGIAGAMAQTAYPPYRASATTLPDITVPGRSVTAPHYKVPAGYDADVALHPYTSGLGPCTDGSPQLTGCRNPARQPIPPSHYDQPPFTR